MALHLSPKQISKNISPQLAAKANLTKPLTSSEPHRPPGAIKFVSPITITNIRSDLLPPPPPINHRSNQKQPNKNRNPNSNTQPKSRLQGIKRPHSAIHQRDQRNEYNNNRHRKLTRQKTQASTSNARGLMATKPLRKPRRRANPNSYGCLCAAAQSFTAFSVFSTCFSGDKLVYS